MLGYQALREGADPAFLAVLASAFALPALVGALPVGRISDRFGGARLAALGLLFSVAGCLAPVAIPGLTILVAASSLCGLGQTFVMVGLQTIAAHSSKPQERDRAFGTLTAAASVGQLVGAPAVTGVAMVSQEAGTAMPNTAAGLLLCSVFVILALPAYPRLRAGDRFRATRRPETRAIGLSIYSLARIRGMRQALTVSGAVLVTIDLLYAFMPVWAIERGIDPTVVGLLLAVRALVSTVCRFGLGWMVASFGRKKLLVVSLALGVAGLISLPVLDEVWAIVAMVAIGVCLGLPQPLTMAWVTSLVPASGRGAALGLRITVTRVAQVSLPLLIGLLAAPTGALGVFWANSVLLLGAGASTALTSGESSPDA